MALLKQSTAYTRMFLLVDSTDHVTGKTGVTPTVTLSKAGGAFGAAGGAITEVANGFYKIALTTTDTNTLGDLAFHATGTACDPTDFVDQVSARIADDLATQASVDTVDDFLDTEIAAIKAKTDNLPTDPADQSAVEAAITAATSGLATAAALDTVDNFLDTEVAAIKAKTDLIPATPAAVADVPTALQNADALLNRDMAAVSDTNARSPLNALRFLRNKWSITGTTLTVTEENDSTAAWTATITSDAAADPITGSDPT